MKRRRMSLTAKSAWTAQLFILPFYLGFLFFFLSPMLQSLRMSFSDISVDVTGYSMAWIGFKNFRTAFLEDTNFTTNLIGTLTQMVWRIPVTLFLSLLFAMILNQKFKGRIFVRAIFFMPVIFASGIALQLFNDDIIVRSALTGGTVTGGSIQYSTSLKTFMMESGFGTAIVDIATGVSDSLFSMVWRVGVQMIIFLAGLQNISPSLYEASSIEGAGSWENLWKITLPVLSPIIFVNLIYTIIDNFTDSGNVIMRQITQLIGQQVNKLGLASSFAWTYFAVIGIILAVITLLYRKLSGGEA